MTMPELAYAVARGGVMTGTTKRALIALHGRLSLGASCFFLSFLAISIALLLPASEHRVRDFLICVIPAVLIFTPLFIAGPSIARRDVFSPAVSMWLPNMVLFVLGSLLLWRAFRR